METIKFKFISVCDTHSMIFFREIERLQAVREDLLERLEESKLLSSCAARRRQRLQAVLAQLDDKSADRYDSLTADIHHGGQQQLLTEQLGAFSKQLVGIVMREEEVKWTAKHLQRQKNLLTILFG